LLSFSRQQVHEIAPTYASSLGINKFYSIPADLVCRAPLHTALLWLTNFHSRGLSKLITEECDRHPADYTDEIFKSETCQN